MGETAELVERAFNALNNRIEQLESDLAQLAQCPYPLHDHVDNDVWVRACNIVAHRKCPVAPFVKKQLEKLQERGILETARTSLYENVIDVYVSYHNGDELIERGIEFMSIPEDRYNFGWTEFERDENGKKVYWTSGTDPIVSDAVREVLERIE